MKTTLILLSEIFLCDMLLSDKCVFAFLDWKNYVKQQNNQCK